MAGLWKFKKGRQHEHLAKYILGNFCFVSEPSTVADDAGTDLFCTVFEKRNDALFPKNTFAIQIKSNKNEIKIKNNEYFINLEMPYLIGVISKDKSLAIYGGESLIPFFHWVKNPGNVEVNMVFKDENYLDNLYDPQEDGLSKYDIFFNKIADLSFDSNYEGNYGEIEKIRSYCALVQRNISSVVNKEYLLFRYGNNLTREQEPIILRGPESVKHFKNNFVDRLIEVFYNIERQYNTGNKREAMNNFNIYKKIYKNLKEGFEDKLPEKLTEIYNVLKNGFNKNNKGLNTSHKYVKKSSKI